MKSLLKIQCHKHSSHTHLQSEFDSTPLKKQKQKQKIQNVSSNWRHKVFVKEQWLLSSTGTTSFVSDHQIIILISKNLISAFLRVLNNDHHSAQELGTRSEPWWGSPMLCPISPAAGRLTRETTPSLQVSPESGITSMSTSASTRGNLKQSFASLHPVQPSLRRPLLVPSLQFLALAIAITGASTLLLLSFSF